MKGKSAEKDTPKSPSGRKTPETKKKTLLDEMVDDGYNKKKPKSRGLLKEDDSDSDGGRDSGIRRVGRKNPYDQEEDRYGRKSPFEKNGGRLGRKSPFDEGDGEMPPKLRSKQAAEENEMGPPKLRSSHRQENEDENYSQYERKSAFQKRRSQGYEEEERQVSESLSL